MSDTILTDKTLKLKSQEDDENENVNENVNDKTLMSSKGDDEIIKILMHSYKYAETTNQNEKKYNNKKTK